MLVAERQVVEGHVAAVAAGADDAIVAEGVEAHASTDDVAGLPIRLSTLPVPVSNEMFGFVFISLA